KLAELEAKIAGKSGFEGDRKKYRACVTALMALANRSINDAAWPRAESIIDGADKLANLALGPSDPVTLRAGLVKADLLESRGKHEQAMITFKQVLSQASASNSAEEAE